MFCQFDRISTPLLRDTDGACWPGRVEGGLAHVELMPRFGFVGGFWPALYQARSRQICETAHSSDSKLLDCITVLKRGTRARGIVISAREKMPRRNIKFCAPGSDLARGEGLDGQCMNVGLHQCTDRFVYKAMPGDPG